MCPSAGPHGQVLASVEAHTEAGVAGNSVHVGAAVLWRWIATILPACVDSRLFMYKLRDELQFIAQVLAFVEAHTEAGVAQLAGNSVHVDAVFLRRWMPRLAAHLHYRIVDVSTVMELCRRWFPKAYRCAPRKKVRRPQTCAVRCPP